MANPLLALEVARALLPRDNPAVLPVHRSIGIVQAVSGGAVTVELDGGEIEVGYLASYHPQVGDAVLVDAVGSECVAVGRVAGSATVGSNTNGGWLQFGDILVCWHEVACPANVNPTTWTFPREFAAAPTIIPGTMSAGAKYATHTGRTATQVSINHWATGGSVPGTSTAVHVLAIGHPA